MLRYFQMNRLLYLQGLSHRSSHAPLLHHGARGYGARQARKNCCMHVGVRSRNWMKCSCHYYSGEVVRCRLEDGGPSSKCKLASLAFPSLRFPVKVWAATGWLVKRPENRTTTYQSIPRVWTLKHWSGTQNPNNSSQSIWLRKRPKLLLVKSTRPRCFASCCAVKIRPDMLGITSIANHTRPSVHCVFVNQEYDYGVKTCSSKQEALNTQRLL